MRTRGQTKPTDEDDKDEAWALTRADWVPKPAGVWCFETLSSSKGPWAVFQVGQGCCRVGAVPNGRAGENLEAPGGPFSA